MQRSMLAALCAGVALMTAVSAHATNVAVADTQAAFLASNFAKKTVDDLNATLKPQRDKLEQLRAQLQALEARFEKDGKVMTDADRKALQAQAQSKMNEYTSTAQGVQRRIEETQATMEKLSGPRWKKSSRTSARKANTTSSSSVAMWSGQSLPWTSPRKSPNA